MIRTIIQIDEAACNGCGACANACHEGAIAMVNGKATLLRDDYCDGLGNCLPVCPTGAIRFVEREAAAFDPAAVPGTAAQAADCARQPCPGSQSRQLRGTAAVGADSPAAVSHLAQWPVQLKLAPVNAPYFEGADLLIAADCAAYACGDFHPRFMAGRVTLIGCPKLDEGDYSEKLTAILRENKVRSVTVVRMEVPCCGGIQRAVETALRDCGTHIPRLVVTLGRDGTIIE
ncbi:MAG: 4Fe-4S binding protein [Oscillibacter sp.]